MSCLLMYLREPRLPEPAVGRTALAKELRLQTTLLAEGHVMPVGQESANEKGGAKGTGC